MKLAEELGRSRDEVTSHQKVSGPWAGDPGAAVEVCGRQGAARRAGSSEMSPVWRGLSKWDFTSVPCVVSPGFQARCYWAWGRSESTGPLKSTGNLQASRSEDLYEMIV